jgi:hypothetical protein
LFKVGIAIANCDGCEIVVDVAIAHPFTSVAVTVYVPTVRLLIVAFVPPLLH